MSQYIDRLDKYIINPLIPNKVKKILEKIFNDIFKNLKVVMPKYLSENYKLGNNPINFWNSFNHKRTKHEQDFDKLRNAIAEFLKVHTMDSAS